MRTARTILAVAVTFTLAAPSALAQDRGPREHRGFWIGFGFGGGWNVSEGLDGESLAGGAAFLRMGGTLSQQILIGGEVIGWGREIDGADLGRGNATFTVMYYPSINGGLYVKGGVGFAELTNVSEIRVAGIQVTTVTTSKGGFGTTLGVGYDIRLARNFYLSPTVDWLFQVFEETPSGTSTNNIILLTVGATWH